MDTDAYGFVWKAKIQAARALLAAGEREPVTDADFMICDPRLLGEILEQEA